MVFFVFLQLRNKKMVTGKKEKTKQNEPPHLALLGVSILMHQPGCTYGPSQ
jgi:hypothetical protein